MTIKTVQFFGQAYGDAPVTLQVSLNNGPAFFNSTVPTLNQEPPVGLTTEEQVLLFTMPVDADFHGALPMSVTVSGGTCAILGIVKSNYSPTGVGTNTGSDVYAPFSDGDARSNVKINGEDQTEIGRDDQHKGSWGWLVTSGSTLTYNLNL